MRLKNFNFNEIDRLNAREFAQKMLNIDNVIIIVIFNDDNKSWISWHYDFLTNNSLTNIIKQIYFEFKNIFSNVEYLKQQIILVIVNIDVKRINNVCVINLYDQIHFKYNNDKIVDSKMKKKNSFEYFHNYDEISLSFYILQLKMNIFIMFFRNIRFFIMCNDIRAKLTRVTFHVLKIEMISNKSIDEKILIFRISLDSKNDEINKNRKKIVSCQFIKRQFSIRAIFVMTINKSQKQSLRYVNVDIRIRKCFIHDQLYVVLFKIIKKCNFHMINFDELDDLRVSRKIRNIQWKKNVIIILKYSINWILRTSFFFHCFAFRINSKFDD